MHLYRLTQDEKYKIEAFHISEKSKATLLRFNLWQNKFLLSGIKDEQFLDKYKLLVDSFNLLQDKLNNTQKTEKKYAEIQSKLNDIALERSKQIFFIKEQNQDYFTIYKDTTHHIDTIRQYLIPDTATALLNFFTGPEQVTVFLLTKDSLIVHTFPNDSDYKKLTANLRASISEKINTENWQDGYDLFTGSAFLVYKTIFPLYLKQQLKKHIKKLVIIPDNTLSAIPFEILLTHCPDTQHVDYKSLPYLLKP